MPAVADARTAEMLKLREAGRTFDEIGAVYGISSVRVLQILQKVEGSSRSRGRRQASAGDLAAEAGSFAQAHHSVIKSLAASGATRSEVVERFRLFMPDTDLAVIGQGITASRVIFDSDGRASGFSSAVVKGAVWYVLGVSLDIEPDRLTAIKEADIQEAREVGDLLRAAGIDASTIANVLCRSACARAYARAHPGASLARKQYDSLRLQVIDDMGLRSGKGTAWWPPTGLTVMKRLGNGYWADALSAIGLAASSRGRPRGPVQFDDQDCQAAINEYVRYAVATGSPPTQPGYQKWVEGEQLAGRHRPSASIMRRRYKTWRGVMRTASQQTRTIPASSQAVTTRTMLSRRALHDARQETDRFLAELSHTRPADASAPVVNFTKSFWEAWEVRRREWLRAMIILDDTVAARRLADPSTPKKIRDGLSRTPPDLAAVLSYVDVDKIGGRDPRRTDGWLRPDAQAELDAVPDGTVLLFDALKQVRNYLTHLDNSERSRARLSAAIMQLTSNDPRFELNQPITPRVVIDWLRAKKAQRLRLLSSSVTDLWRAMVIAEGILAEPQQLAVNRS